MSIPKIMHFVWGNETLSYLRYLSIYSFIKFNPSWKVYLHLLNQKNEKQDVWKEESGKEKLSQDYLEYNGKDYFNRLRKSSIIIKNTELDILKNINNPIKRSDIYRWFLLSTEGGFYSDTDIIYIKSIDDFYEKVKDYDAIVNMEEFWATIGFLACKGNDCKFFKDIYNQSIKNISKNTYQCCGAESIYNVIESKFSGETINQKYKTKYFDLLNITEYKNIYNFESKYVYPIKFNKIESLYTSNTNFDNETFGIHWFGGTQISQKYNNLLDYNNINTTIKDSQLFKLINTIEEKPKIEIKYHNNSFSEEFWSTYSNKNIYGLIRDGWKNEDFINRTDQTLLNLFDFNLNKNDIVVDLGCGIGYICKIISNKVEKYIGIDFCENILNEAKKINSLYTNAVFIKNDGKTIPLENSSVSVIISELMFHHIFEDLDNGENIATKYIEECFRILKNNGKLCLQFPLYEKYGYGFTKNDLKNYFSENELYILDSWYIIATKNITKNDLKSWNT